MAVSDSLILNSFSANKSIYTPFGGTLTMALGVTVANSVPVADTVLIL
jgi:hypothetical protein